jgi:hypothetical protein
MWPFIRQALRYIAAVLLSPAIGSFVGIPFAFALDVIWGGDVTGGNWPLTVPNIVLVVIQALAMGFAAGWIAGRRGKLIATLADFFLLEALIVISLILNRDVLGAARLDTEPVLWVWIGLIPAWAGGHYAVKSKHLGYGPVLIAVGAAMALIAQIGAAAFHLYTSIVAYEIEGIGPAVLAFMMPMIAEFWWFWKVWGLSGSLWNLYTVRLLLLIGWTTCAVLAAGAISYAGERRDN